MSKVKRQAKKMQDDEEVEDLMAWGNRRENFYQEGEDQYSRSGQEEAEAQRMYERQFQQLGEEELYDLPQQDVEEHSDNQDQNGQEAGDNVLSRDYLTKEIARVANMGLKISEETDSKVRRTLESQIQAYLMALIGLRELKIPYIEHHPLFNATIEMKQDISKLKRLFDVSTQHEETGHQEDEDEQIEEEDLEEGIQEEDYSEELQSEEEQVMKDTTKKNKTLNRETSQNIQKGLKIYEQTKKQQEESKALVREQKRHERFTNKKPAFLEVKGDEGRLASEKILKNKGLIKKRKKIDRNSRVKLRRKFDKATSKRRAAGHVMRQDPGRNYEGEKNIRFGRIASTKLK